VNLAPRDVEGLLDELRAYHASFSPLFARAEQRHWALQYLQGLLLDLPRKSVEPMALALRDGNIRAMQQFIGEGAWDDTAILAAHQRLVAQTLGEPDGVLIVDGSEFPKKGEASVGVARQYCGALGKIANCQAGVFVAYASQKGYTLLDRRLYMPAVWFTPCLSRAPQTLWGTAGDPVSDRARVGLGDGPGDPHGRGPADRVGDVR